jgi:N-acetylglucosamine-6-phosphate deacetylase
MSIFSISGCDPVSGDSLKITVENGCIQAIASDVADEATWLSPGLIDLQVNDYCGYDLNADSVHPDVVISLTHKLISIGVTTFIPTIITASEDTIIAALRAIAAARRASPHLAHAAPFVHLEGPHISSEGCPRRAHPREHIRPPSLAEFVRWQAASRDLVGMVTISPHWEGTLEYIETFARKGILVAIRHTDTTAAQIHAAADAGATLSTHLGNGVANPLPGHPNLIWAQLAEDRLTATFIADDHHLSPNTLKVMLYEKGVDRSVLVSDTVALAGMPPGVYDTPIGGRVNLGADGRLSLAVTLFLAGAVRPLKDAIAHIAGFAGFSLVDAIQMDTKNPGGFVGRRGVLSVGADADLVRSHWNAVKMELQMQAVLVQGKEWQ